jgi:hypothetical protein
LRIARAKHLTAAAGQNFFKGKAGLALFHQVSILFVRRFCALQERAKSSWPDSAF